MGDLFGDRQIAPVVVRPRPARRPAEPGASPTRLVVVALLAAALARLFDIPLPEAMLFVGGEVVMHAVRAHRRVRQAIRPFVVALFFTYGPPTIVTPFAPAVRMIFFFVLTASAVVLYEWTLGKK